MKGVSGEVYGIVNGKFESCGGEGGSWVLHFRSQIISGCASALADTRYSHYKGLNLLCCGLSLSYKRLQHKFFLNSC